ncbi:hypothetical protein [Prauserella flavalba]|uniref:hypothetical protein n=1 Tax=Prauserella flavalba TaxID=1477506 RepID=UPI003CCC8649
MLRSGDLPRLAGLGDPEPGTFGLSGLDEAFELALRHYLDGLAVAAGSSAGARPVR